MLDLYLVGAGGFSEAGLSALFLGTTAYDLTRGRNLRLGRRPTIGGGPSMHPTKIEALA